MHLGVLCDRWGGEGGLRAHMIGLGDFHFNRCATKSNGLHQFLFIFKKKQKKKEREKVLWRTRGGNGGGLFPAATTRGKIIAN